MAAAPIRMLAGSSKASGWGKGPHRLLPQWSERAFVFAGFPWRTDLIQGSARVCARRPRNIREVSAFVRSRVTAQAKFVFDPPQALSARDTNSFGPDDERAARSDESCGHETSMTVAGNFPAGCAVMLDSIWIVVTEEPDSQAMISVSIVDLDPEPNGVLGLSPLELHFAGISLRSATETTFDDQEVTELPLNEKLWLEEAWVE